MSKKDIRQYAIRKGFKSKLEAPPKIQIALLSLREVGYNQLGLVDILYQARFSICLHVQKT